MMSSQLNWDTHEINTPQSNSHQQLFDNLHLLVQALEATPGRVGSTMLDDTVIAVISEMGRTPRLNAGGGKDHWPVTTSMVIGPGIAGARVRRNVGHRRGRAL